MIRLPIQSYRRPVGLCFAACILIACSSCGIFDFLLPPTITVRLTNNGTFPVQADVVFSADPNISRDTLVSTGTHLQFTIQDGQEMSFSRSCLELQAVAISDAELQVVGSAGPHTESDVVRSSADFDCRDVVTFNFDNSVLVVDFDVTSSVEHR